jgi:hypothetical protein
MNREGGHSCLLGIFVRADKTVRPSFSRSRGGVEVSIHVSFSLSACVVTVRLWGMIPLQRHQAGHCDADASQEAYALHSVFSVREGSLGGIVGEPPLESGDESLNLTHNFCWLLRPNGPGQDSPGQSEERAMPWVIPRSGPSPVRARERLSRTLSSAVLRLSEIGFASFSCCCRSG